MPLTKISATDALPQLDSFSTVIDARSESEYSLDRLPGAVNWPTLNDQERHEVGTEYKQVSAFDARKRGAVMATRNIARHIETHCADKPKNWKPLVYCWRGGQRSGSLSLVLSQIGFDVHIIDGGYKAFRAEMLIDTARLTTIFDYCVICGPTGSGKTRLLTSLAAAGAQVLDLEALAQHRSSVLGLIPGQPQPSQKHFDTRIWDALRKLDPGQTVWAESESKKVGNVSVPDALMSALRASNCARLELPVQERVKLLMEDYDFFVKDPVFFCERLDVLKDLRGKAVIEDWKARVHAGQVEGVVRELLEIHYDPGYASSTRRNYQQFDVSYVITTNARADLSERLFSQNLIAATATPQA
jgi:tRNA 2-selenouridine synthase